MKEKKIILRLFYFLLLFILMYSSLLFLVGLLYNSISFKIDENRNVLVIGNSTGQFAINDDKTENIFNFSLEAESYLYTYVKLRKMFEYNQQIDTVLLSYSYMIAYKDNSYITNHIGKFIPQRYNWFEKEEFDLFKYNKYFWSRVITSPLEQMEIYFRNKKNKTIKSIGIGGFRYSKRDRLKKDIERRKNNKIKYSFDKDKTLILRYIEKISELCLKNNSKLILIQYPIYFQGIDEKFVEEYKKFNKKYLKDYLVVDLNKKIKINKKYFGDINHLNFKGADTLTSIIEKRGLYQVLIENTID